VLKTFIRSVAQYAKTCSSSIGHYEKRAFGWTIITTTVAIGAGWLVCQQIPSLEWGRPLAIVNRISKNVSGVGGDLCLVSDQGLVGQIHEAMVNVVESLAMLLYRVTKLSWAWGACPVLASRYRT